MEKEFQCQTGGGREGYLLSELSWSGNYRQGLQDHVGQKCSGLNLHSLLHKHGPMRGPVLSQHGNDPSGPQGAPSLGRGCVYISTVSMYWRVQGRLHGESDIWMGP